MAITGDWLITIAALLLILGVVSSIASSRLGVPALVLFLGLGMLAGSDGLGGIAFNDAWLAQFMGIVALAFILFSGGLGTHWQEVRPVLAEGLLLATAGVIFTTVAVGVIASQILGLTLLNGLLLGAIVSSTDAAAVFSVLGSRGAGLKKPLQPILELESGGNDPMAVFLTLALISLIQMPDRPWWLLGGMLIQQMGLGLLLGYAGGRLLRFLINRIRLDYEGLYPVFTLAMVLLVYGTASLLGGSGFLAVYVSALVLGQAEFIHKKSLLRFHDGLAWLMQIVMFLTLGLLAFPHRLPEVALPGLLVALCLIFVARPLAVFISLAPSRLAWRKKAMISWLGLRGAVPIILATFPLMAGVARAELFFHIVFFIVITSVLVQGTTLPWVARWLRVSDNLAPKPRYPLEFVASGKSRSDMVEVLVPPDSRAVGRQLVELGLPPEVLVVIIHRHGDFIVPRGATVIEAEDTLLVLANKTQLAGVSQCLQQTAPPG